MTFIAVSESIIQRGLKAGNGWISYLYFIQNNSQIIQQPGIERNS